MNNRSPAARRYLRRFVPTMTAYVVALFGSVAAINYWHPEGAVLVLLAVLPALPILGIIGAIALYVVEEEDEYQRRQIVAAMLAGLAFMLSLATVWGFLEPAGLVPHAPAYWAFVLWCLGWGFAQGVLRLRDRLTRASA